MMKTYLSFNYPNKEQLMAIDKYHSGAKPYDYYICRLQVLDNQVDADFCKVSPAALEELGKHLVGKTIKIKEYFPDEYKPTEYEMRVVNFCVSTFLDQKTNDYENLTKLYVDAFIPVGNISSNMYKQIEDKIQGSSFISFSFNREKSVKSNHFKQNIKLITGVSDAYEVVLEYPSREERNKWKTDKAVNNMSEILNDNSMKNNSVKNEEPKQVKEKDCNGCMGASFGDCADCTGKNLTQVARDMQNFADNVKKLANGSTSSKDISALNVPVTMQILPMTDSKQKRSWISLNRSEIKNLIDFFDCNMQMHLQLDDVWDGNMAYLCEMSGIYNKLLKAKEGLEELLLKEFDENDL